MRSLAQAVLKASALDITTKRRLRNISPSIEQNPETQGPRKTWERLRVIFSNASGGKLIIYIIFAFNRPPPLPPNLFSLQLLYNPFTL